MKWRAAAVVAGIAGVAVAAVLWVGRTKPITVDTVVVARGTVDETVTNTRAGTVKACQRARLAPPTGGQIARLPVKKGDQRRKGPGAARALERRPRAPSSSLAERDARRPARDAGPGVHRGRGGEEANRTRAGEPGRSDKLVSDELAERAAGEGRRQRRGVPRGRRADQGQPGPHRRRARARLERTHAARAVRGRRRRDQRRGRRVRHALARRHPDAADGGSRRRELPLHHRADRRGGRAARARGHEGARHARRVQEPAASRRTSAASRPTCSTSRSRRAPSRSRPRSRSTRTPNLLPGYSADVEIILDERPDVLRVPTRALIEGKHVYVLEGGRVASATVETGVGNWEFTEITQGLAAGDAGRSCRSTARVWRTACRPSPVAEPRTAP